MNNPSSLVTVAMLSAMLSEKHSDYLDLISPFILTLLPPKIGDKVDKTYIISEMKNQYGFEEFPIQVLNKILNRFSRQKYGYMSKSNGDYYVTKIYEHKTFNENRLKIKSAQTDVMQKLRTYLQENTKYKTITIDKTRELFMMFLEKKGLAFIDGVTDLRTITIKDYDVYHIARFILSEYENSTLTFDYIEQVVKGFFVYKSIYFFGKEDTQRTSVKLRNVVVILDTKLLIEALNYNTVEGYIATKELISLITEAGGKVATFSHLIKEVEGILVAYAKDKTNRATFSLQRLNDKGYDEFDILRLKNSFVNRLRALGVEIIEPAKFSDIYNDKYQDLKINELSYSIQQTYKLPVATTRSDNDVLSVVSVYDMRGDIHCSSIDECRAVVTTPNMGFLSTVNEFYSISPESEIGFIISDLDLTAILWLRSWNKRSKLPCMILLENAYAACELTPEIYHTFCRTIDKLKSEGKISEDEALLLRTQRMPQEYLLEKSQNDPDYINDSTVLDVLENYRNDLSQEKDEQVARLEKEIKERNLAIKKKKDDAVLRAESKAQSYGVFAGKLVKKTMVAVNTIIFVIGIFALISDFLANNEISSVMVVLFLIGLVGYVDMFLGRKGITKKVSDKVSKYVHDKAHRKFMFDVMQNFSNL